MADSFGVRALLQKLTEDESPTHQEEERAFDFVCQYNLLRGMKVKVPLMEREKLNQWKKMATKIEEPINKKRQGRNGHIREQMNIVEQRIEKNRLLKMQQTGDTPDRSDSPQDLDSGSVASSFVYSQNYENSRSINSNVNTDEKNDICEEKMQADIVPNKCEETQPLLEKLNNPGDVPLLINNMKSLQVLQARQNELDTWYEKMQQQLEFEKIRLTEKYDILHLQNIKEQQSVIDCSQEYLRSVSRNNTPVVTEEICKSKLLNNLGNVDNTPVLKRDFLPTKISANVDFSLASSKQEQPPRPEITNNRNDSPINILHVNENNYVNSQEGLTECTTPPSSPGKNNNAFDNIADLCEKNNSISISNPNTKRSPEKVCMNDTYGIFSNSNKKVIHSPPNNRIPTVDPEKGFIFPREYVDANKEINGLNEVSPPHLICNGISEELDEKEEPNNHIEIINKSLSSPDKYGTYTVSKLSINNNEYRHNTSLPEKDINFLESKPSILTNEIKTAKTVSPRASSRDSLKFCEYGIEQMMSEHNFNDLKARRKSKPVKFFTDLFPSEEKRSSDFDDEYILSPKKQANFINSVHTTVIPSASSNISGSSSTQQVRCFNSTNASSMPEIRSYSSTNATSIPQISSYNSTNAISIPQVSYYSSTTATSIAQINCFTSTNSNSVPQVSCFNSDYSTTTSQVNSTRAAGLTSTVQLNSHQSVCSTSTPHRFEANGEQDLELELSAVVMQTGSNGLNVEHPQSHIRLKLHAIAKGFLMRRLLNTIKVQDMKKTIKDTEEFLNDINKENISSQKLADRQLRVRLQDELSTKRGKLHDIFFNMAVNDQMKMIALSRTQREERDRRKKQTQVKKCKSQSSVSRNILASQCLSAASQKSIKRKQINVPKPKSTEKTYTVKKTNKVETTGGNIHVCISAGALKPIQSCTSPTLNTKKVKTPTKNGVQNRYLKKSTASKRLNMNSVGSIG